MNSPHLINERNEKKTVSTEVKCFHSVRYKEVVIAKLRCGHRQLNACLHQIRLANIQIVSAAIAITGTITHFLTECYKSETRSAILAAYNNLNLTSH